MQNDSRTRNSKWNEKWKKNWIGLGGTCSDLGRIGLYMDGTSSGGVKLTLIHMTHNIFCFVSFQKSLFSFQVFCAHSDFVSILILSFWLNWTRRMNSKRKNTNIAERHVVTISKFVCWSLFYTFCVLLTLCSYCVANVSYTFITILFLFSISSVQWISNIRTRVEGRANDMNLSYFMIEFISLSFPIFLITRYIYALLFAQKYSSPFPVANILIPFFVFIAVSQVDNPLSDFNAPSPLAQNYSQVSNLVHFTAGIIASHKLNHLIPVHTVWRWQLLSAIIEYGFNANESITSAESIATGLIESES